MHTDTPTEHKYQSYTNGLRDLAKMAHVSPPIGAVLSDVADLTDRLMESLSYHPIETAPKEGFFYVAGWDGDMILMDEEPYDPICWSQTPVWREELTHDESWGREQGISARGWQHRNGPFGGSYRPTHWRSYTPPAPPPSPYPVRQTHE